MKFGVCSLTFALAMALSVLVWGQEPDAKQDDAKPAADAEPKLLVLTDGKRFVEPSDGIQTFPPHHNSGR